jgi:hypothetical protein
MEVNRKINNQCYVPVCVKVDQGGSLQKVLLPAIQSAEMKLSGSKIVIASFLLILSPCGFFCWIAMCL